MYPLLTQSAVAAHPSILAGVDLREHQIYGRDDVEVVTVRPDGSMIDINDHLVERVISSLNDDKDGGKYRDLLGKSLTAIIEELAGCKYPLEQQVSLRAQLHATLQATEPPTTTQAQCKPTAAERGLTVLQDWKERYSEHLQTELSSCIDVVEVGPEESGASV